jgi:polyphosphate kinase
MSELPCCLTWSKELQSIWTALRRINRTQSLLSFCVLVLKKPRRDERNPLLERVWKFLAIRL